ncbi:hypothetical protein AYL99_09467 [Fonsecaea erecta]|uniref:Uncharacterized protein n=1 Tax=Fonsecaea erecta TaxID=1367422 RepID=A0A178Z922_9EURO|nr:hypothetical protein AYL99_09467 [Fonsecaea erecta]OAP56288.1 hypothetical protein AYL99_09467 [Fonsecaea erecta]
MSSIIPTPTPTSTNPAKGTCTVLLFASASTFAGGVETVRIPVPTTLRGVFAALEARFPGMRDKVVGSAAVTVNLEYVDFDFEALLVDDKATTHQEEGPGGGGEGLDLVIRDGDEVGIIPPVSSG